MYGRSGREFFETEKKILTKATNNKFSGFPKLYSTKSSPQQFELLMECLGQNLRDAEYAQPGQWFKSLNSFKIVM